MKLNNKVPAYLIQGRTYCLYLIPVYFDACSETHYLLALKVKVHLDFQEILRNLQV